MEIDQMDTWIDWTSGKVSFFLHWNGTDLESLKVDETPP
jgi:hypothetical protein